MGVVEFLVGGVLVLLITGLLLLVSLRIKFGSFREVFREVVDQLKPVEAAPSFWIPPFQIELMPVSKRDWHNDRVEEITAVLESRGFVRGGDFRIVPLPVTTHQRLLTNETQAVYAAISEQHPAGVWFILVTAYENDKVWITSSLRDHLLDPMPGRTIRFHEGAETDWLLEEHFARRPVGKFLHLTAGALPCRIQRKWTEEFEWLGLRGGPTAEELQRIAARDGVEATPEGIAAVRQAWQVAFHEYRMTQLELLFSRESLPGGEDTGWLMIYERIPVSAVVDAVDMVRDLMEVAPERSAEDGDTALEEREPQWVRDLTERANEVGARAAFAEAIGEYLGKRGFRKLRSVESPVPADLYMYRLPPDVA